MARYIDADELYKATQKRIAEANEARMAVVDDEFLDLINDAFTEDVAPIAEWISVEERLPEPYTWVTVYNPNGKYTKIDTDEIVGGNWVRNCGKVTHWMPLPEPPRETEREATK